MDAARKEANKNRCLLQKLRRRYYRRHRDDDEDTFDATIAAISDTYGVEANQVHMFAQANKQTKKNES